MAFNDFMAEEPNNYEQKTLCCIVVDVSRSMAGPPIAELNQGLDVFYNQIDADDRTSKQLEVALVAFNDRVDVPVSPALVQSFTLPNLSASGSTKLVEGVREGIRIVQERKEWYRSTGQPYLRPWIILITDGAPDQDQDVSGLADEIANGVSGKHFMFFALGVQGADMGVLQSISAPDMQPAMLNGIQFSKFFKWLSSSMSRVSQSQPGDRIAFDPPDWLQGYTVSS